MAKRQIIEIDRAKCNGCGLCTRACAEEALKLDQENKVLLVKELYCDGLGACLAVCPTGALKVVTRESEAYDPAAAYQYVKMNSGPEKARQVHGAEEVLDGTQTAGSRNNAAAGTSSGSALTNWPVQLQLISPAAPSLHNCELLISADCTAFACGNFHRDWLAGKVCIIACPKLDNTSSYLTKLTDILAKNTIRSVTVVIMSVPCCSGLYTLVAEAAKRSGKDLAVKKIVIDIPDFRQAKP